MSEIKPPIFLLLNGSFLEDIYLTVDDLEINIEAYDVESGDYTSAYDAEGKLLSVDYDRTVEIWESKVFVSLKENEPKFKQELESELRIYLKGLNDEVADNVNSDLPTLVQAIIPYAYKPPDPDANILWDFFKDMFLEIFKFFRKRKS